MGDENAGETAGGKGGNGGDGDGGGGDGNGGDGDGGGGEGDGGGGLGDGGGVEGGGGEGGGGLGDGGSGLGGGGLGEGGGGDGGGGLGDGGDGLGGGGLGEGGGGDGGGGLGGSEGGGGDGGGGDGGGGEGETQLAHSRRSLISSMTFSLRRSISWRANWSLRTTSSSVSGGGAQVDEVLWEAPTHSSTQKAASHLSRWAPLILVSAGFFWCLVSTCWSSPMLELRVAFFWGKRLPCLSTA